MICENCNSSNVTLIDEYKFNVEFDKKFFHELKIANCKDCKFSFAFPPIKDDVLEKYYSHIYRSSDRPHVTNMSDTFTDQFLGYMSSLTTFVEIKKIKKVYEIGPGTGMFGMMLKKLNPEIIIYCVEPDIYSQKILQERGYIIIDNDNDPALNNSIDLVVSIHSMEHFPSLKSFNQSYLSKLKLGGYFFFEVPNCKFHENFLERVYDSPHLLFFNKESITAYAKHNGLTKISILETSNSIEVANESMAQWKEKHSNWKPSSSLKITSWTISFIKSKLKFILNNILRIDIKKLENESNPDSKIANFYHNNSNGWCVRGLLRK